MQTFKYFLPAAAVIVMIACYSYGELNGRNAVIDDCVNYSAHKIVGTTDKLLCHMDTSEYWGDSAGVAKSNAKLYSKENKDLHKKDRK